MTVRLGRWCRGKKRRFSDIVLGVVRLEDDHITIRHGGRAGEDIKACALDGAWHLPVGEIVQPCGGTIDSRHRSEKVHPGLECATWIPKDKDAVGADTGLHIAGGIIPNRFGISACGHAPRRFRDSRNGREFIEDRHGVVRCRNFGGAIDDFLDRAAAGSHVLEVDAAHHLGALASGAKDEISGFVDRGLVVAVEELAIRARNGVEVVHDRSPREGFRNRRWRLCGSLKACGEQRGSDRPGKQCLGSPRDGGPMEWIS